MPELPEVETTRRGIEPHVVGQRVAKVIVRDRRLRWPVPESFEPSIVGQEIQSVARRAKYLVLDVGSGHFLIHLGMSGSLRILTEDVEPGTHDHIDVLFENGSRLRYNDPRRFGSMHWVDGDPAEHWLLADLGPEPLSDEFDGQWLHKRSRGRKGPVKNFIMHQSIVVGVGNIYASEALFLAGVHPARAAGRVSVGRYERLATVINVARQSKNVSSASDPAFFAGGASASRLAVRSSYLSPAQNMLILMVFFQYSGRSDGVWRA